MARVAADCTFLHYTSCYWFVFGGRSKPTTVSAEARREWEMLAHSPPMSGRDALMRSRTLTATRKWSYFDHEKFAPLARGKHAFRQSQRHQSGYGLIDWGTAQWLCGCRDAVTW